ncbi:hypothetical protein J31TS4_09370 [Paenibacillus sp. J31TS4]|uniref:ABC transporter permease n=1 Tax=Paenibacillus sp. J31TS4 TaxID=2807195 RepID=UPI001B2C4136|nr:ABC transporter permease [Paenibacillus sp. J31TS4]GIP37657.1 hypothetical protein J31TS4_09370 [Paenibacillus sp. J31TS4]
MALLVMIVRKMVKTKWLELSLLLGLILSVGLMSSLPIYTDAILQRMLFKDLQNMQTDSGSYPGTWFTSVTLTDDTKPQEKADMIRQTDEFWTNRLKELKLPLLQQVRERRTDSYGLVPVQPDKVDASVNRGAYIGALEGMEGHVKLIDGRMPAKEPVNGVYEALVVDKALTSLKMVLGNEFLLEKTPGDKPVKIVPVGVIDRKSEQDLYWYNPDLSIFDRTFLIDFDLFEKEISTGKTLPLRSSSWYGVYDYTPMDMASVANYKSVYDRTESYFRNWSTNFTSLKAPAHKLLADYHLKEERLRTMLWSLVVPVVIVLAFYLYMVSNLIIERQKTEIAVLRSRGASRLQILAGYAIEGLLLGIIAFAAGPPAGLLLTKVLGASDGFLSFVQRASLNASINAASLRYAAYAVACSIGMTLIPAFLATRASIVDQKRQSARQHKPLIWHRLFLDVILIAVSIYELRSFRGRLEDLTLNGLEATDIRIDPLLFLVPSLFMLGAGLLLLRVYPYFIRLVYWLGRRFWPPYLYATLIQVGRSGSQYQFLMLFLILTIATGMFGASAARTINRNTEDQIRYASGADFVLQVKWPDNAPPPPSPGEAPPPPAPLEAGRSGKIQYIEPPFQPFTELPGVKQAAKVFIRQDASYSFDKEKGSIKLMGIDTDEFGRTAWMRDGLLGHHLNDYLNLIASDPSAVLVSRTLADEAGLKPGDTIFAGWNGTEYKAFSVYGVIDYFPTFNPNPPPGSTTSKTKPALPKLVVGHLSYIQNHLALEPYEVWLKLEPDASREKLYAAIQEQKMELTKLTDTRQKLTTAKNDPFQLAINGVMTLGFLLAAAISFCGFLLYWVLSLQGRLLQFGIMRAMGITFRQLIGMLTAEQLLTSAAAVLMGLAAGQIGSRLFVPLFQITFNPQTQVPPFRVAFDPRDTLQLTVVVVVMIVLGLAILGSLLSRVKIHQAVKLGED